MDSKKIIGIVIAIVLVSAIVIVGISMTNKDNKNVDNNQYTNISEDTFVATVIANDKSQVVVIPNEDELIRQSSFDILNAVITSNTKIFFGETELTIDQVQIEDVIKVTFDGKIYDVKPGRIIAQKIEVVKQATAQDTNN